MKKLTLTALFLASLLSIAHAQTPILAYDVSPPDAQCSPPALRNCYIPAQGVWGPVNPAVGGPSVTHAFVQFTLTQPQWIKATFYALSFLYPVGGAYTPGIGIDGYDSAHLCNQFQAGITDDNSNATVSSYNTAICLIQLPAGTHNIYAMEMARASSVQPTVAFRGVNDQALIVEFY